MNHLHQYHQQGYLILKDFVSHEACDSLIQQANVLLEQFQPQDVKTIFSTTDQAHTQHRYFLDSGDQIRFFFEKNAFDDSGELKFKKERCVNKIAHALHTLDPVFSKFSYSEKIVELAKLLNLSDPLILQSMYIFKQPYIGDEVTCHQDNTYLHVKDHPITGFWFALEDATIDNGCLWVIPNGHRTPLKSRMIRDFETDRVYMEHYDETPWPLDEMIPLEVPRGSLIVLHGLMPHMSKENTSGKSRNAFTLHMISSEHDYSENNWLKRPVAKSQ